MSFCVVLCCWLCRGVGVSRGLDRDCCLPFGSHSLDGDYHVGPLGSGCLLLVRTPVSSLEVSLCNLVPSNPCSSMYFVFPLSCPCRGLYSAVPSRINLAAFEILCCPLFYFILL